jgi:response regulator RpfG family c-di-GMP phosphodiesterase
LHTCLPDGAGLCALHGQVMDLIFVDADSPNYPAARLCQAFKHNLETRTVPLIVVSSSAKACEEALAQGADDFATPQTLPALLLRRIEALVHVRRARQILRLEDEVCASHSSLPWSGEIAFRRRIRCLAFHSLTGPWCARPRWCSLPIFGDTPECASVWRRDRLHFC